MARNNITFKSKKLLNSIQYPPINKSEMFIKGHSNKSSDSSENYKQQPNNQVIKIDVKQLNQTLSRLRKNSNKLYHEVENSSGQLRDDFKQILMYIQLLYNTDNYEVLFNMVYKHFNDLKNVKPGTIGAYFGGCFNYHNVDNTNLSNLQIGCIPVCAGSMPPSKSYINQNNWSFCDDTVIWLKYNTDAYTMTILHTIPNSNRALIFLNISNFSEFNGFTDSEKNQLSGVNIKQIKLIGVNDYKYVMLTSDWIPLENVKSRNLIGQLVNNDIIPLKSKCACIGSCGCNNSLVANNSINNQISMSPVQNSMNPSQNSMVVQNAMNNSLINNTMNDNISMSLSQNSMNINISWIINLLIIIIIIVILIILFLLFSSNDNYFY